ncbi:hypothetical protein K1T71_011310 [Dendrolimus kikuchii]|uniref:Uncharacterized protein n=1 Tax=Dendrolimus kikuchii TaxID=765133 RepID=A0ACC1CND8_9NEOP|nr:hypothetical protein K1T71_011310 [Dendrolimus kikuchii]
MEKTPPHPLIVVTPEDIKKVRQLYATDDVKRIKEGIDAVQEWIKKQDHLSEAGKYLSRTILERVYIIEKGSLEATKKRVEKMLTFRGMMPELCMNRTVGEFETLWDCVNYVPLPKLNPSDRSRVMVTQFLTEKLEQFSLLAYFRYCYVIGEYRLNFDYTPAERFIIDLTNIHIGLLGKLNPVVVKKAEVLCSEGIGTKIKGIHILHAPPFIDKLVMLLKQALREKVANRVHVHNSYEDLYKHIPKEILPKDYGGDETSCSKLSEQWRQSLKQDDAKRLLKESDKLISDESKRHESKFNEEYMDKPGDMDKAIDILQEWITKQEHLIKKDFTRDYLERAIISMKGSVERAKTKIDKICTMRTLVPRLFQFCDVKNDLKNLREVFHHGFLPKLTQDHKRVYIAQPKYNGYNQEIFFANWQAVLLYFDHCTFHDYNDGFISVHDLRNVNIVDFVAAANLIDARDCFAVSFQGYSMRIKEIHIISESKAVDILVAVVKKLISRKLLDRIHVLKTVAELHNYVPKEILPADFGGNEKQFAELCDDWVNVLSEDKNVKYFKHMRQAGTNESLRQVSTFNEEYMDKPGDMDKAIDVLQDWLMKQAHLIKKDFSRDYLERAIISMKGSVERAKTKLDKLCTMRTLLPRLFQCCEVKADFKHLREVFHHGFLPKLTDDHKRVYIGQAKSNAINQELFFTQFQSVVLYFDHCTFNDYNDGYVTIHDIRNVNIVDFVAAANLIDARDLFSVAFVGYALRIKEIHIISESKAIDILFTVIKNLVSKKLMDRIHVHKTVDTLHDYVSKEILPRDFGGNEKQFAELCDDWVDVLSEEKNVKYFKDMREAGTSESFRQVGKFNEEYMGMPGTFRTLTVD